MKSVEVKVGMLVSYDYHFLYHSIPLIYDNADSITLAVDNEYRSWTGLKYPFDEGFWQWIDIIDTKNKIKVYRDNFHLPELDALANDTRERNLLAQYMGEGGWIVQIDSDEYFIDFPGFVNFLKKHSEWVNPKHKPIDIGGFWIPLFKKTDNGFLYVENSFETFPIATNKAEYTGARGSDHFVRYTPFYVFHQTWARTEEDIWMKLNSWGHVEDFNITSYFNLWKSIDKHNFRYLRNVHPITPGMWQKLNWCEGKDIEEFIANYKINKPTVVPNKYLLQKQAYQIALSAGIISSKQ